MSYEMTVGLLGGRGKDGLFTSLSDCSFFPQIHSVLTEKQLRSLICDSSFYLSFSIFGFVISSLTLDVVSARSSSTVNIKQLNSLLQETNSAMLQDIIYLQNLSLSSQTLSLYNPI